MMRQGVLVAPAITATKLGDESVEFVHGVIHPPQVALVGFGKNQPAAAGAGGALKEQA